MNTIGPAIVLVLATIGLARTIKVGLQSAKHALRALGRRFATLGDVPVVAPVAPEPPTGQAQLQAAYERTNALTIADVERIVGEALAKAPRRKREPEVTGN